MKFLERITIDPNICHGKPCIRGMRWPVVAFLDMLGSGMKYDEIIDDHPEIEVEDIYAAINYAALYINKTPLKEVA